MRSGRRDAAAHLEQHSDIATIEAVSRVGRGSQFEFNHKIDGSEGSIYNVYIPMGMTAENVADRADGADHRRS